MALQMIDGKEIEVGQVAMSNAATMTGLELMRAIAAGDLPGPSIGAAMNFRMVEVNEGKVTFAGTPHEGVMNPIGTVHGGWAATILELGTGLRDPYALPRGIRLDVNRFEGQFRARHSAHDRAVVRHR